VARYVLAATKKLFLRSQAEAILACDFFTADLLDGTRAYQNADARQPTEQREGRSAALRMPISIYADQLAPCPRGGPSRRQHLMQQWTFRYRLIVVRRCD
jgi:hypothetical protein